MNNYSQLPKIIMKRDKKIALIAQDNKNQDVVKWAKYNREFLANHQIYAINTTGTLLEQELDFTITKLKSGPPNGDQQIGGWIADGEIDFMIFFSDPLEQQTHDLDIKALLRMAIVWNIPIAFGPLPIS